MVGLSSYEGGVEVHGGNDVEEEGDRKGEDTLVVMRAIVMVRAARESIHMVGHPWFVKEMDIVVAQGEDVASKAAVNLLGASVVLEILVIGKNINNESGTQQQILPVLQHPDDGEELMVPDGVVVFCLSKGGRIIAHGMS